MTEAYISLGSNIEPETNMLRAVESLSRLVRITGISTVYLTPPVGGMDQPDFLNCVIRAETDISPRELKFRVLRSVEVGLGRVRTRNRYASRTIDLDLLIYGDMVLSSPGLRLPDPDIFRRPFLAEPVRELSPGLTIPGSGRSIEEIVSSMDQKGMVAMNDFTKALRSLL